MIFTRDFVTRENHCRIASLVTKKSLFTVTHALFFISLTNFENYFWIACLSYFYTPISVVSHTFIGSSDLKLLWSIGRTNCLCDSTRVDLYSHQILFDSKLVWWYLWKFLHGIHIVKKWIHFQLPQMYLNIWYSWHNSGDQHYRLQNTLISGDRSVFKVLTIDKLGEVWGVFS